MTKLKFGKTCPPKSGSGIQVITLF